MTTREDLATLHTAAIRRHWRTLADGGGVPSAALLDDLAAIADHHEGERTAETLNTHAGQPDSELRTGTAAAAAKPAAPRRTSTRKTT